jgi:UPF0755 protein
MGIKRKKSKRGKPAARRVGYLVGFAIVVVGLIKLYQLYDKIYGPNVWLEAGQQDTFLYIPTGSDMEDVRNIIIRRGYVEDSSSFTWLAQKKNYPSHVHPGRYRLEEGMSNNELINLLRSGRQEPVSLIFNNIRSKRELAGVVSEQIEADSSNIVRLLNDKQFLEQFDMNSQTIPAIFIPNTYELYWDTPAKKFIKRMHREYRRFWTKERRQKARNIGMDPVEATTLASIVDEETIHDDEMPDIAGVYINRLKQGMRLQADPTIKYAIGDFTVNRVLKKHLEVDSPYNTYKNAGLPPGPISIPSIAAIRSVLHYSKHDYLYFAAKPDFSGYHNFSTTHRQHIINARKYQRALNRKAIME